MRHRRGLHFLNIALFAAAALKPEPTSCVGAVAQRRCHAPVTRVGDTHTQTHTHTHTHDTHTHTHTQVTHHGHRLRKELLDMWRSPGGPPLPGSVVGPAPADQTDADMRNATFCLCPPGHTQARLPFSVQRTFWLCARAAARVHRLRTIAPLAPSLTCPRVHSRALARTAGHVAPVARGAVWLHPGHVLPRERPAVCSAPGRALRGIHAQRPARRLPKGALVRAIDDALGFCVHGSGALRGGGWLHVTDDAHACATA